MQCSKIFAGVNMGVGAGVKAWGCAQDNKYGTVARAPMKKDNVNRNHRKGNMKNKPNFRLPLIPDLHITFMHAAVTWSQPIAQRSRCRYNDRKSLGQSSPERASGQKTMLWLFRIALAETSMSSVCIRSRN
jgi:hypothetical protein